MNEIDSPRPTPQPARPGIAASGLAAAVVALSVVFITLVAAPSPRTVRAPSLEDSPETFTTLDTLADPSLSPTPAPAATSSPAAPSAAATPIGSSSRLVDPDHVATRVRVRDLRIDLAVVAPPRNRNAYPKCGVAMYLAQLHQPGEDGATYLYAHARKGMFLPIYERAILRLHGGPKSMLGLPVEVFTSDNLRYLYRIADVRVHQTKLRDAARAKTDEVWLQTSEGPKGTRGKTQLRAVLVSVDAATEREAHPASRPVTCG